MIERRLAFSPRSVPHVLHGFNQPRRLQQSHLPVLVVHVDDPTDPTPRVVQVQDRLRQPLVVDAEGAHRLVEAIKRGVDFGTGEDIGYDQDPVLHECPDLNGTPREGTVQLA
jgi:hypothetical protein